MYIDDPEVLKQVREQLGKISDYDLENNGPWGIFSPCEETRQRKDLDTLKDE